MSDKKTPVLSVRDLSVAFGNGIKPVQVTDRVSFDIYPGEFFALVGESGCGKSVTAMSLLQLLPKPSAQIVNGTVLYDGCRGASEKNDECGGLLDLSKLSLSQLQKIRGSEIACIFQEPMQALDPVVTIKKQLLEVFRFTEYSKEPVQRALTQINEQLCAAGFKDPSRVLDSYPHELSGGMLQRICIVMALLSKPRLIIADEPTTALDVTVQAQVLAVLKKMASEAGTAVLLITHNMGIVSQYAHQVAVMYAGRIVETGPVNQVILNPLHPYTQGLLAAIPESHKKMELLKSIPGSVPHPKDFVDGCRFADRCEFCSKLSAEIREKCKSKEMPPLVNKEGHCACCFGIEG